MTDPCQFCQNLYDDSDYSVGWYGCGCKYADTVDYDVFPDVKPCPGFQPILASDYLEWQLYNEQMAEEYREELE